uniref:Uncharacterized protein n=1 Tax=Helianthus annuus TaxID=4232 RepID=A0A251UKZ0_HELAN
MLANFSTPVLFTSRLLKFSKLHNLTISPTIPFFSSSAVNGFSMKAASFCTTTSGCFFISSYFKNKILSGNSKLTLQYDKTCSQNGPYSDTPRQKSSNASSNERGG